MVFPKKILSIVLVLVMSGLAVYFIFFNKKPENPSIDPRENDAKQAQTNEETPLPVKVTQARRGDLVIKLKSPGEAVTERMIIMKAEVPGVIIKLHVEEGKHVKKGDLLVELDDKEYRLELERAEALRLKELSRLLIEKKFGESDKKLSVSERERIEKLKRDYERMQQLYEKGLISRNEFEKARRQYELAMIEAGEKKDEIMESDLTQREIEVKKAQMQLEKTRIRAPFSGIITDIQVSPFEHVTIGRELFTLVNISRIKVEAQVLESEIGRIKVGRAADLRFSAYPDKVFMGRVKAVSPIVNPENKTCRVTVDVANPQEEIKPGMHAEVEIAAEIYKNRLLVPQEAVLVSGGRKLVFVVEGGLAKWRYIEVGLENEDYAEVLEGVKEGEPVIIEGHFTLAHDSRVRVVK
ncbi:MAG: efflux RND transporter periplasmic adaptor subunit [Candidatus Aminicenantales bacterium]